MGKRWLFTPLVVGLLALALGAGTVMAQGEGEDGSSRAQTFASRLAAILGLDEGQVQDALTQAKREAGDEHFQMMLDRMVEKGKITQEQADEKSEWFEARPEGMMPKFHFRGRGRHGGFGGQMPGNHFSKGSGFFHPAPEEGTSQGYFGGDSPADPLLTY